MAGVAVLRSVLDEGEELTSPRVVDAVAPGAVVMYHAMYERGGAAVVDALPGGSGWREAVEAYPEDERHLAIHEGHLVKANPRDEPHVADLIPIASATALTGTSEQVAARMHGLAAARGHRSRLSASGIRHRARAARLRIGHRHRGLREDAYYGVVMIAKVVVTALLAVLMGFAGSIKLSG